MAWEIVAQGPPNDFFPLVSEVEHGTRLRLEVETLPGLAYLAEAPGIKWMTELGASGMNVDRVYREGNDMLIIEGRAESIIGPIVIGILSVLAIVGIAYIVRQLILFADIAGPEVMKGITTALTVGVIVTGGCVVLALLSAARRRGAI